MKEREELLEKEKTEIRKRKLENGDIRQYCKKLKLVEENPPLHLPVQQTKKIYKKVLSYHPQKQFPYHLSYHPQ